MADRILVTGGGGFIGSHLVEELVRQKREVRVLDDFSTGKWENLAPFRSQIEVIEADLKDRETVRKAMEGCRFALHAGAVRAVLRSVENPQETNDVNVTGTLHVLQAAREFGVERVVYSSSSSVYGDSRKFLLSEEDTPSPESPYAATKLMGEYYCRLFTKLYGVETVSLRYFNVFGPRQNPESRYSAVIPIFIANLLQGEPPEVHWDGKQSRDFTYIDNVVEGNMLAMKAEGVAGEVFNIATSEEHSVLEILRELAKILGVKNASAVFTAKRPGDIRRTRADIRKATHLLHFQPKTRFKPGLKKTVDWFVQQGSSQDGEKVGRRDRRRRLHRVASL